MAEIVFLEWEGQEREYSPKSADWYWVLGIIALALTVASILFEQYLLAAVIVAAAIAVAIHAAKEPPVHRFRLVDRGLIIGTDLHPFEKMRSFSFLEDIEGELPPVLSIKTENFLTPHLVIPLKDTDAEAVYAHFLARVEEAEHHPTFTDVVALWLGF